MPRLTPIHWKRFERFLLSVGCTFERERGDHRIYWKKGLYRPLVIPCESQLPIFIIRNNLRVLNIEVEEYLRLLKNI